jgi:hypothetical protein
MLTTSIGPGTDKVYRIARTAIDRRLGYTPERHGGVYSCDLIGGDAVLRLNSGGNALAVAEALRANGYSVRHVPTTQPGSVLIVEAVAR